MNRKQLNEFRKSIECVRKLHSGTRKKARKFLQEEGILTTSGRLTNRYGGGRRREMKYTTMDAQAYTLEDWRKAYGEERQQKLEWMRHAKAAVGELRDELGKIIAKWDDGKNNYRGRAIILELRALQEKS